MVVMPFSTNLLFRVLDVCQDLVQMAKTKKSQRNLGLLRKEYQKNVQTEIKPQTRNSKSITQTSEESKNMGNLLKGLI